MVHDTPFPSLPCLAFHWESNRRGLFHLIAEPGSEAAGPSRPAATVRDPRRSLQMPPSPPEVSEVALVTPSTSTPEAVLQWAEAAAQQVSAAAGLGDDVEFVHDTASDLVSGAVDGPSGVAMMLALFTESVMAGGDASRAGAVVQAAMTALLDFTRMH